MAVTGEQSAPYVAPGVFIPLLERNREKGLPNPLTAETLQRLGVSDSLVPRTLQALKTLDLIGEDGRHTEILERFRRAPEADYLPMMGEWLKNAYAHALDVIDPATADDTEIRDAFRHYNPVSMQPRMITLFTALFEAAGVRAGAPRAAPKKAPLTLVARSAPKPSLTRRAPAAYAATIKPPPPTVGELHPALAGLLAGLPAAGRGWTQADRDRFMAAFGVVLDFAHPPGVFPAQTNNDSEAEDGSV